MTLVCGGGVFWFFSLWNGPLYLSGEMHRVKTLGQTVFSKEDHYNISHSTCSFFQCELDKGGGWGMGCRLVALHRKGHVSAISKN